MGVGDGLTKGDPKEQPEGKSNLILSLALIFNKNSIVPVLSKVVERSRIGIEYRPCH